MAVGPVLAGVSLACVYAVVKDLFIYIKHRRRRVKDLRSHYENLELEVDILLKCWEDINHQINRQSATIEPNQQHKIWEKKVRWYKKRFQEIKQRYTVLCKDLESRVETEASENQSSSQNQTNTSTAGIDNQRSQEEAVNEDQITQEALADPVALKTSPKSCFGFCHCQGSNPHSPCKFFKLGELDKEIVKLIPEVSEARDQLAIGGVTCEKKPKIVERKEALELNTLHSHQKHLDDLRQLLKQENFKRIGICGSYGVGKTNIMKNLNNCFDSSSPSNCDFDYVIWVTVGNSEERIIETMQAEIIGRLKLPPGTNRNMNSNIISTELSQKKYLLLLDDFSPSVDLEEVGIKKEHQNGKVVLVATSFYPQIRKQWDEIIEVKSLSDSESRELFMKYIDYKLTKAQQDMISPILKEVGGAPGLITSIARLLNTHRQEGYWEGIKHRLQSDVGIPKFLGLGVYIKLCEELERNDLKKCFLYAALFPNEYMIPKNTLVECWKAENFLICPPTLKAARSEGSIIFTELEMRGLLENCGKMHVKMPVLFRKAALVQPFPPSPGGDRALCPYRNRHLHWKNFRMVSMIGSNLEVLPTSPTCSCISTLLLQLNKNLSSIRGAFFTNMYNLRVLDLHGTGIAFLPLPIFNLKKLRSLYLNSCRSLEQLPTEIGQLNKLEVLDIRHTLIRCSLDKISKLVNLRCLRISCAAETYNLSGGQPKRWIFPPMIYKNLTELEELTIEFSTEVSAQVVVDIEMEVTDGFHKRGDLLNIFLPYSGQADEENCEHLDGENNTSSGDHTGNNTVNPSMVSTRKGKGKEIAIAEGNMTPSVATSSHERDELKEENKRLKEEIIELQNKLSQSRRISENGIDIPGRSAGEGTSSLNAEASENQSSSQNQTVRSTAGIDNQKSQEENCERENSTSSGDHHGNNTVRKDKEKELR